MFFSDQETFSLLLSLRSSEVRSSRRFALDDKGGVVQSLGRLESVFAAIIIGPPPPLGSSAWAGTIIQECDEEVEQEDDDDEGGDEVVA